MDGVQKKLDALRSEVQKKLHFLNVLGVRYSKRDDKVFLDVSVKQFQVFSFPSRIDCFVGWDFVLVSVYNKGGVTVLNYASENSLEWLELGFSTHSAE